MRMIFEQVDNEDFFEIILTEDDYDRIMGHGIIRDFPLGLFGDRNLNVFIRVDNTEIEED